MKACLHIYVAPIEYYSSLFTLGAYDQYFGVQMQRNSEKGRKLQKNTQCALFRGQGGAIGKISENNI